MMSLTLHLFLSVCLCPIVYIQHPISPYLCLRYFGSEAEFLFQLVHMSLKLSFILVKYEDQSQVKGYVEKACNYGELYQSLMFCCILRTT